MKCPFVEQRIECIKHGLPATEALFYRGGRKFSILRWRLKIPLLRFVLMNIQCYLLPKVKHGR